jgi:hypothetical protein
VFSVGSFDVDWRDIPLLSWVVPDLKGGTEIFDEMEPHDERAVAAAQQMQH